MAGQPLGADLNCFEVLLAPERARGRISYSRAISREQPSHDRTANHGRGDGSQTRRSIGRVEAPPWSSDKSLKAAGLSTSGPIETFWVKPMPGTANGRGPGK
jgi:hypothetical protein